MLFFADPSTPHLYTLSLHDALPIPSEVTMLFGGALANATFVATVAASHQHLNFLVVGDRKSTRLNSSHVATSYAVFCLKKKTAIGSHRSTSQEAHFPPFMPNDNRSQ